MLKRAAFAVLATAIMAASTAGMPAPAGAMAKSELMILITPRIVASPTQGGNPSGFSTFVVKPRR